MWLIVLSLSPHDPHLYILLCFVIAWTVLVFMTLFCAASRKDLDSLLKVLFLSHIQIFLCEILLVSLLKFLYNCFSSLFCFLVFFILLLIPVFVLFLVAVISLSLLFYVVFESSYWFIDAIFFSFLDTYSLCRLGEVRLHASSRYFLFSDPFLKFFPSSL